MPYQIVNELRQHHPEEVEEGSTTEQDEDVNAAPPTMKMVNPTLLKYSVLYFNCVLTREAEEGSTQKKDEEKAHTREMKTTPPTRQNNNGKKHHQNNTTTKKFHLIYFEEG